MSDQLELIIEELRNQMEDYQEKLRTIVHRWYELDTEGKMEYERVTRTVRSYYAKQLILLNKLIDLYESEFQRMLLFNM